MDRIDCFNLLPMLSDPLKLNSHPIPVVGSLNRWSMRFWTKFVVVLAFRDSCFVSLLSISLFLKDCFMRIKL